MSAEEDIEQVRLTVNVLAKADAALTEAALITGESRTDCVGRALLLYAELHRIQAANGVVYVQEAPGAPMARLRVL